MRTNVAPLRIRPKRRANTIRSSADPVERLAIYSPLASAMTESCAAIRLSEPWAACW